MNSLFKLFGRLHKSGKSSKTYNIIKKFYKQLFFIVSKGQANVSDQKTRSKLWKNLLGNFSDLLNGISESKEFIKGRPKLKNENYILEADNLKGTITFIEFDLDQSNIDDTIEEFNQENNLDNQEVNQDVANLAFLLYGKDVGRLLPRYSTKFSGIKSLFGLLNKGGYETSLEKAKEKWGVSRFDFKGDETLPKGMSNLPMYNVEFIEPLDYSDKEGNKFKINKGDILKFNYDKDNKVLIHKISKKFSSNVSQIYLDMDRKPEEGKEYNTRLTKIIPSKGGTFVVESNIRTKIKILEPQKK